MEVNHVLPSLKAAEVVHFSFDLWMKQMQDVFGLMVSCTVLNGDVWVIREFCIALVKAESTHTDVISDILAGILSQPEMQEARIANKTASATCDGGANLKCLMEALRFKVGCSDLFPNMARPISSQCQPHLINTVSRSVDAGPRFNNYEVDRFCRLGFARPSFTISDVVAQFRSGRSTVGCVDNAK